MTRFENILLEKKPLSLVMSIFMTIASIVIILLIMVGAQFLGIKLGNLDVSHGMPVNNFSEEIKYGLYLVLFGFAIPFISIILWRKFIDKLPIVTLFTNRPKFRWGLFLAGLLLAPILLFSLVYISYKYDPNSIAPLTERFKVLGISNYIIILIVYAFCFVVQSSFEEVFLRSHLIQSLRRMNIPTWVSVVVSSVLFGILHMQGTANDLPVIFMTGAMGIGFAIAAIRTQGIEITMGTHFVNNLIVAGIMGQTDNSSAGNDSYLGGVVFVVLYLGLLEFVLFWFPSLLGEPLGKDALGAKALDAKGFASGDLKSDL